MSLKITFVTETFPPEVNGVAMTVGRLVSGMRERGHRVSVIRPRQGKADACPVIPACVSVCRPVAIWPDAGGSSGRIWCMS